MATMEKDTSDSDIYEDTEVMPPAGTTAPGNNAENTIYEPLRMEGGRLSQVQAAANRKAKCAKRGWWIAGAVVTVILCVGLSLVTVKVAGAVWASNKPDVIQDIDAHKQQTTNTLQEQVNIIQLQLQDIQRAMEEETAKLKIEKTKLEEKQSTTEDQITNMEKRLQSRLTAVEKITTDIQSEKSRAKTNTENNIDKVENRLTELESTQKKKTTAFSVYPSDGSLELDQSEVVPFNTIILDSMGGFVKDEHKYICPTTGAYFFSLCLNFGPLGGTYKANSEVTLEVGGNRIMDLYSRNSDAGDYNFDQGCDAIIYKCTAGSSVLVKCNLSSGCRIVGKNGRPQSILSAFLIYPE